MRIRTTSLMVAVLLLAGLPVLAGTSEATGAVKDQEGNPIVGAVLIFAPGNENAAEFTGKTNKKGRYYIPGLFNPHPDSDWSVKIEAEGFLPVEMRIESRTVNKVIVGAIETVALHAGTKIPEVRIRELGTIKIDWTVAPAEQVLAAEKQAAPVTTPEGQTTPVSAAAPANDPWDEALGLASAGDLEGSLPFFEKAIKREPEDAQRVESYAQVLYRLERFDEAKPQVQRAIELSPEKIESRMLLYGIHIAEHDLDQAKATLEQAREIEPQNVKVLQQLAYVASESGDIEQAIASYETVVEADPTDADAWLSLADLYNASGQTAKSEQAFQRVSELEPDDAHQIFFNLGALIINKADRSDADTQKAILAFRKAVELKPDYALAHKELALALLGIGDHAGAKDNLSTYVELVPDAPDATRMQALINSIE